MRFLLGFVQTTRTISTHIYPSASSWSLKCPTVNEKDLRKTEEIKKTEKYLKHWTSTTKPHFIPEFVRNKKSMLSHPSVNYVYYTYVCYVNMNSTCNTTCTKWSFFWLCKGTVWSEICTTRKGCRWYTSTYAQERERVLLQRTRTLLFVKDFYEKASHFLPNNNRLDSHLIVYGRSVTAYFPL